MAVGGVLEQRQLGRVPEDLIERERRIALGGDDDLRPERRVLIGDVGVARQTLMHEISGESPAGQRLPAHREPQPVGGRQRAIPELLCDRVAVVRVDDVGVRRPQFHRGRAAPDAQRQSSMDPVLAVGSKLKVGETASPTTRRVESDAKGQQCEPAEGTERERHSGHREGKSEVVTASRHNPQGGRGSRYAMRLPNDGRYTKSVVDAPRRPTVRTAVVNCLLERAGRSYRLCSGTRRQHHLVRGPPVDTLHHVRKS